MEITAIGTAIIVGFCVFGAFIAGIFMGGTADALAQGDQANDA